MRWKVYILCLASLVGGTKFGKFKGAISKVQLQQKSVGKFKQGSQASLGMADETMVEAMKNKVREQNPGVNDDDLEKLDKFSNFKDLKGDDLERHFKNNIIQSFDTEQDEIEKIETERKKMEQETWSKTPPSLKDRFLEANADAQKYNKENGGIQDKWLTAQQGANKKRMEANLASTIDRATKMQSEMDGKQQLFRQTSKANEEALNANLKRFMGSLKDGFEPLKMNLIAGHGTDLDGNLIEPSSFEISMDEHDDKEVWATVGDESSDNPISEAGGILDLLIKECYQGMASGNQEVIDKNCLRADILTYRCQQPVDASFYIGVTFDINEGYNSQGFRGKLVKHWCREMNKYKGVFDVPDGMHIQGVYETKVSTTTYSSVDEYISALTKFSNSQSGESSFRATRDQLDSRKSQTSSESKSASGGFGGFSAGGSSFESKASASQKADATLTSNKNQKKEATLNEDITKNTTRTTKMVGEMSVSVIRYEMFLREVKPNYIHEDFLDCFLMLPQSFFSPKAPEKFQDFIQRYGTHYVKAAKFGGQLKIVKTRQVTTTASITDFRKEMQTQINEIVGNAVAKGRSAKASKTAGQSIGGSASYGGFSGGADAAESKSASVQDSQSSGSSSGSASSTLTADGSRTVDTTKNKEVMDSTIMEVSGGSHKIATSITDLYSLNFRSGLMQWLRSIPVFPKPFDFVFEPITKLLNHLVDDMIDEDMYQTCIINKEDYFVMERTQRISCGTVFAQTSDLCKTTCTNATESAECSVPSPRLLDCNEIVEKKEKIKRKISALDTAISLYVQEGSLHPKSFITIPVSAPGCTTAYRISKPFDDFDKDFGESEEIEWSIAAFNNIQLQFNMKKFFFSNSEVAQIGPNARFVMFYDNRDRRWYTKDKITDPLLPSTASQTIPFSELKSTETSVLGQFKLIPKPILDGDDEFVSFRLNMGLYVDVNLKNADVIINQRSLNAMKASSDIDVIDFLAAYQEVLEEMASGEDGEVVGFINPIIKNNGKTPFPCTVAWANAQRFESTDDIQQCVKVTVTTTEEYFFVMAASLSEPTAWIYIHQTQNDLCIHKLDANGNDEINSCAPRLQFMVTGKVDNMAEQMYVCIYKMGTLLSIAVQRPTYNRNERESATTILTYNYVEKSGENVMPRYFALGAGESEVKVKNIYMVEIETLECQLPFVSQRIGGTFRCVLECHEECSDLGCHSPNDNTSCVTCRNSKFIKKQEGKEDVVQCVADCSKGDDMKKFTVNDLEFKDNPDNLEVPPSQIVCMSCHHECKEKCYERSEYECEGDDKCENFKIYAMSTDAVPVREPEKCIDECPVGYWARLYEPDDALNFYICEKCPDGCAVCDMGHSHKPNDGSVEIADCIRAADGSLPNLATCPSANVIQVSTSSSDSSTTIYSDICLECTDGYYAAVINTTHSSCHDTHCPAQFQQRNGGCSKAWRPIGYQHMDGEEFTATCDSEVTGDTSAISCNVKVGKNFLTMGNQVSFDKFISLAEQLGPDETVAAGHGIFSFQFAWRVDECTVVVLEWKQNFNPLKKYAVDDLPNGNLVEIEKFQQLQCKVSDPAAASLKKISFSSANFFINCPNLVVTKFPVVTAADIGFTGLALNRAKKNYLLTGSAIGLYSFGQMTIPESEFIPAYKNNGSIFYSNEMQLSVHDDRLVPTGWSSWTTFDVGDDGDTSNDCEMDCTTLSQTQKRTRYCKCYLFDLSTFITDDPDQTPAQSIYDAAMTSVEYFDHTCQPCDGDREKNEECLIDDCVPVSVANGGTDVPTLPYLHHHCCEDSSAFRIIGKNYYGNVLGSDAGFNGVYELMYNTDATVHEYQLLKVGSTKKIVRKATVPAGEYYWVLEDGGTEHLRSSISKCPMDADKWGVNGVDWTGTDEPGTFLRLTNALRNNNGVIETDGFPELEIMCSKGRNTCPDTHPYSYNYGQNCCSSPFRTATSGGTVADAILSPTDDGVDVCLGEIAATCSATPPVGACPVACGLTGNRACRSNLKDVSTRSFKALSDKKWEYEYKLCTQHCNTVYMKANHVS